MATLVVLVTHTDPTSQRPTPAVRLRPTLLADVPALFAMQEDPEGRALAGVRPRAWEEFSQRWAEVLRDPRATMRVIEAGGTLAGAINILAQEDGHWLGYWIARPLWGRGIATGAVGLMLGQTRTRPLLARVVEHNQASLRVLLRHGFVEISRARREATDRLVAGVAVTLRLD